MCLKSNTYKISLIALAVLSTAPAWAQNYPARAIRLIVPSAPGGGTDIVGRALAHKLTEYLGQQVVVDNRAGAGTIIGIELAARSAPDGYTLLVGLSTLAINPSMFAKLPYDALRDLAPICHMVSVPNALVLHPSVPARSIKELIALARAKPNALNVGSAGNGTSPHLSLELFKSLAKIEMVHIPYKGSGNSIIANLAGEVSVSFPSVPTAFQYVKANRLRALGVTTAKRTPALPDVPAIGEIVPGYEATQWFGILAPVGTPRPIIERIHQETVRALRTPEVGKQLANEGADIIASTPEEFGAYIKSETEKWARVIKAAGIKPQ
ncbi:MAG TPA: tripartite tricarboxylate transporter substrate binding protein [Burkholderiales bacterium]|nr:tripartite tricarboxylate transporter substrate binding protein [Burkholderiales bacterium]